MQHSLLLAILVLITAAHGWHCFVIVSIIPLIIKSDELNCSIDWLILTVDTKI